MWNVSYALNLPLNVVAHKYAEAGETKKMFIPNLVLGQLIGFACRFIPAVIVLTSITAASAQADFATLIRVGDYGTQCIWRYDGCAWNGNHSIISFKEKISNSYFSGRIYPDHVF